MNDPAAHPLAHALAYSFACSLALPITLSFPFADGSSRSPLLLSSALGGRRVAILALGLFVKQATELTLSPSRTPLCGQSHLSSRPALSMSPRVSVLIRHFVDTRIRVSYISIASAPGYTTLTYVSDAIYHHYLRYISPILDDPTSLNAVDGWLSKDYRRR